MLSYDAIIEIYFKTSYFKILRIRLKSCCIIKLNDSYAKEIGYVQQP